MASVKQWVYIFQSFPTYKSWYFMLISSNVPLIISETTGECDLAHVFPRMFSRLYLLCDTKWNGACYLLFSQYNIPTVDREMWGSGLPGHGKPNAVLFLCLVPGRISAIINGELCWCISRHTGFPIATRVSDPQRINVAFQFRISFVISVQKWRQFLRDMLPNIGLFIVWYIFAKAYKTNVKLIFFDVFSKTLY